jgi:hypothetical protein
MKKMKSQIAQNVLQMYRSMSATGGAVGQVSDKEQEMFQNNLAALDQAQSKEQFDHELNNILNFVQASKQRILDAYKTQYPDGPPAQTSPLPETGWKVEEVR